MFDVCGSAVEPEQLTAEIGIAPSRRFLVGEQSGRAVRDLAGWEWESACDLDDGYDLIAVVQHS